jgi:uncharacterized membrane protein HdeD (DUF308 family)
MEFRNIARLVMSVVYLIAGLLILCTDVLSDTISSYRTLLGAVLVGYGLLRGWLWYRGRANTKEV